MYLFFEGSNYFLFLLFPFLIYLLLFWHYPKKSTTQYYYLFFCHLYKNSIYSYIQLFLSLDLLFL